MTFARLCLTVLGLCLAAAPAPATPDPDAAARAGIPAAAPGGPERSAHASSRATPAAGAPVRAAAVPRPSARTWAGEWRRVLPAVLPRPPGRPAAAVPRPPSRPFDLLEPDPPDRLAGAGDLLCLAVAIYHESRDQPLDGQLAVASVILNRAERPGRWGEGPCGVLRPDQFSFLDPAGDFPPIEDRAAWSVAVEMAREALERGPSRMVGKADHYHARSVDPDWDESMVRVIRIDDHIFYEDPRSRG